MAKCIHCKVPLVEGESELRIVVGDIEFEDLVPALMCPECDESYVDHDVAMDYELEVARQVALNGPVSGDAFQFLRKAIGLPAVEVASLFGLSPETISRWERGKQPVNPHVLLLLGSLVLDRLNNVSTTENRLRHFVAAPVTNPR